jgi:outer membrane immunogenic protein
MKKIIGLFLICFLASVFSFAQAPPGKGGKQLNAGLGLSNWGVPVYVGLDFGVHPDITIGPRVSYRNRNYVSGGNRYNQTLAVFSFNGNYHFNNLLDMPSEWNFYAGLTMGYYYWSTAEFGGLVSGLGVDAQIGGRYFLSEKFALNLEFGGGTGAGGVFGITVKL